jgi:hypothetical protein
VIHINYVTAFTVLVVALGIGFFIGVVYGVKRYDKGLQEAMAARLPK